MYTRSKCLSLHAWGDPVNNSPPFFYRTPLCRQTVITFTYSVGGIPCHYSSVCCKAVAKLKTLRKKRLFPRVFFRLGKKGHQRKKTRWGWLRLLDAMWGKKGIKNPPLLSAADVLLWGKIKCAVTACQKGILVPCLPAAAGAGWDLGLLLIIVLIIIPSEGRQSSDKKYSPSQISDNTYISQFYDKKKGTLQFSDNIEKETV